MVGMIVCVVNELKVIRNQNFDIWKIKWTACYVLTKLVIIAMKVFMAFLLVV